jgi:hypothetical protein
MARKLATLPSATRSTRAQQPQTRPILRPRIRRGPEHSRDDSITCHGNISALSPHQVVHVSANGDPRDDQAVFLNHQSESDTNNASAEQTSTAPRNNTIELSADHRTQLPFRPAPVHLNSREKSEEGVSSSPLNHIFECSGFGRQRTNTSEETTEGPVQPRPPISTDGLVEAPSIGLVSGISQVRSVRQCSSYAPSSPRESRAVSSPFHQGREDEIRTRNDNSMRAPPTMYLQGYFASPEEYTFREYPIMPRTEPRRRVERPSQVIRTISSNSDPSLSALAQRVDRSATTEDVFWTPPSTNLVQREASQSIDGSERERRPPSLEERIRSGSRQITELVHDRYRGLFGRGRMGQADHSRLDVDRRVSQRFSEASSISSLPYSFYELPVSRQSSSIHPQGGQLPQSQYDGATPSREVSRGGYFSIRPSEAPLRPTSVRVPSFSSPNLATGHYGLSPSPASPYSHGPRGSPRHHHQGSPTDNTAQSGILTGLVSSRDFVGEVRDAASAAQRDLSSPLELLEQRAVSYLSRVSTAPHRAPGSSEGTSMFRDQGADFDEQYHYQRRSRRTSGEDSVRQRSGNSTRSRITTSRHYPAATRTAQRSSENVPVGAQITLGSIQNTPSSYGTNLRGGDMASSPIPLRFSMPLSSNPRHMSERSQLQPYRHGHRVHSPRRESERTLSPPNLSNMSNLQDIYRRTRDLERQHSPLYSSSPASPVQIRRQGSQSYEQPPVVRHQAIVPSEEIPHGEFLHRSLPRTYVERPGRNFLGPSLGQGSRRRPVMTRVPTPRRRIMPQQQNQENSGEAEDERMREEMVAAGMRYEGAGGRLEVMDETPPRLGRFERAALG